MRSMELVLPLSTPFPSPSLALIDLNEDAAIARRELLKKMAFYLCCKNKLLYILL